MNMNLNRTVTLISLVLFAALGQPGSVGPSDPVLVCGCGHSELIVSAPSPMGASQPTVAGVNRPM